MLLKQYSLNALQHYTKTRNNVFHNVTANDFDSITLANVI